MDGLAGHLEAGDPEGEHVSGALQAGAAGFLMNRVFTKLGLRSRAQLVVLAYETGFVRPGDLNGRGG